MFDAIDFKWNNEKLYKANYMQDPFNILTKENLDKLEKHCKRAIHYERKDGILEHQITLDLLYKYEEQQEEIKKKNKIINDTIIAVENLRQYFSEDLQPDFIRILEILKNKKVIDW